MQGGGQQNSLSWLSRHAFIYSPSFIKHFVVVNNAINYQNSRDVLGPIGVQ